MKNLAVPALLLGLALSATGCGGGNSHDGMMTGPGPASSEATLMSVMPAGGAVGVPTSSSMTMAFGSPMAAGMEQYVDLHVGDLAGPTVPMSCSWSGDRLTLTCTPMSPLAPHTTCVLHLGGGLMNQAGQAVNYAQHGPGMGGQWIAGGMMSGSHGGAPWSMMGAGWHNSSGSYGMEFVFTTA